MENEIFEKAPVPKAYFAMALPVVFSMVISLVYNMVDTYFIAGTGNTDLVAGVSFGAPIFTLMIALGDIFGLGGSSVISRLFGQQKNDDGKRMSIFCFYASILCGILVILIMLLLRRPILQLLIGYNYGARNKERLKKILNFSYAFECSLALILSVLLCVVARPLIHLFMDNANIVDTGVEMLRFQQLGMIFVAIVLVTTCTFQSAGKAGGAFWLSVSRQGLIFAIVIFTASKIAGYTGVLAAQAVSDFLTAVMAVVLFRKNLGTEM